MKFLCLNIACGKTFMHPAKRIILGMDKKDLTLLDAFLAEAPTDKEIQPLIEIFRNLRKSFDYDSLEASVCPFCYSKEYAEAPPEPATEQRTEAVLVIDLVTGENLALNKALADGYEIVGRYAKQYTLEKKKPKEAQP